MLQTYHFPDALLGGHLDAYLKIGWFRTGQAMHTTNHIYFNGIMYNAIWLRHDLQSWTGGKTFAKLKARNKHLQVVLQKATVTLAQENLYRTYLQAMPFNGSPSLQDLLYGFTNVEGSNIFNTYQLCIYDNSKLVGCTYFDIGVKSAEGISSFYDPAYKANSLGKYLIYLQIEVCKFNQLTYYYPGYFVPGYAPFDYKLSINNTVLEFYDVTNDAWLPIEEYQDLAIAVELKHAIE
jgi:leucyl-tRNA---protein transferase